MGGRILDYTDDNEATQKYVSSKKNYNIHSFYFKVREYCLRLRLYAVDYIRRLSCNGILAEKKR